MRARVLTGTLVALLTVPLLASAASAQNALVVSIWGGNWKDTVEKVVAKPFTAKTGIPVEFEVGGTIDVAGPVVADGMLYVVSGNAARGGLPGNVLVAFSVEP